MQSTSVNGVNIYNLSTGKAMPQWISDRKKRQLSRMDEYRNRIDLLQDFEFPTAAHCLDISRNGDYIIAGGSYPPTLKVFELDQMSMKCERRMDAGVVKAKVRVAWQGRAVQGRATRHPHSREEPRRLEDQTWQDTTRATRRQTANVTVPAGAVKSPPASASLRQPPPSSASFRQLPPASASFRQPPLRHGVLSDALCDTPPLY